MSLLRRAGLSLALTALTLGAAWHPALPAAHAATAKPVPNKIFNAVLPAIHRTQVPPALPSYIPGKRYATVEATRPGYYAIEVGYTPGCLGNACDWGTFTGQRGATPKGVDGVVMSGKAVTLAHGIKGYYNDFTCGASCGESTVSWSENGYRYMVGLKAGAKAQVLRIANSAIETIYAAAPVPNAIFTKVLPAIRRTQVPPALPSYIPGKFFASVEATRPQYYAVSVGYTADCMGADACNWGTFYGQHGPTPKDVDGIVLQGKAVTLAHGIKGYYHNFTCGASCGESTVSWRQNGYLYMVGLHAGAKALVLREADSAIETIYR